MVQSATALCALSYPGLFGVGSIFVSQVRGELSGSSSGLPAPPLCTALAREVPRAVPFCRKGPRAPQQVGVYRPLVLFWLPVVCAVLAALLGQRRRVLCLHLLWCWGFNLKKKKVH